MNILVDSCCDLSKELRERTGAAVAPLTITVDGQDYVDDGTVDIPAYLASCNDRVAEFARAETGDLLDKVLLAASLRMKNAYSRADA